MIKKKVKKQVKRKNPFTNTNDVKDYISKNSKKSNPYLQTEADRILKKLESEAEKILSQFGKNIKFKYLSYGYFSESVNDVKIRKLFL